jgi:hypothetical protein
MKQFHAAWVSLLSIGLALSAPSGRADEPASPPAPAVPPASPGEGAQPTPAPAPRHAHTRGGYVLSDLTEKLGLTEDQQKTIGPVIRSYQSRVKELRGDDTLSKEDRRAKMREIATATHDQIRAALTPDQQKVFDAMPPPGGRPKNPDSN